jgi:hypothetical protein
MVYLAHEAPIAVVLRRGPESWTRLSLWHTDTDTFSHGQWLQGRVYERRCDLSPDGSVFVYLARRDSKSDPARCWLALSRPPYFTALALWFVGDSYHTGGFFPDDETLWIGFAIAPPNRGRLPNSISITGPMALYLAQEEGEPDRTVFINRQLRDGWTWVPGASPERWERRHDSKNLTLIMIHHDGEGRPDPERSGVEYLVRAEPELELYSLGDVTWADWDQRGRLVLAQQGRLLSWEPPNRFIEITDLNNQIPETIEAPDWARS